MLAFARSGPPTMQDGGTVVVLLHGRGSDRHDLQGLRPGFPAAWPVLTPEAPFPGAPWGYGPGWAWYRYLAEDRVDEASLEESLAQVHAFLGAVPDVVGARPARIVLGGFSQGGTVSLAYALAHPDTVAAVLNFSGFLADADVVHRALDAGATPRVFWGHGLLDPAIPHGLARRGRARLEAAGVRLAARDYPIGHGIDARELEEAVAFAAAV